MLGHHIGIENNRLIMDHIMNIMRHFIIIYTAIYI